MATWSWIVIMVAILVIVAVAAALITRQRRTAGLRDRFGAEYERTLKSTEDRRTAETELLNREKQRSKLEIRPLSEESRTRYAQQWRAIQEQFVDEPTEAVSSADALVHTVMAMRGYPIGDFSAQSDLVSVDYPEVAENYRVAHAICERARSGQTSTEDLREVLLRYRSLFGELLGGGTDTEAANDVANDTPDAATPNLITGNVPAQRGAGQDSTNAETGNDSH